MTFERENLKDVDSDVSESKKEDDALAQEKIVKIKQKLPQSPRS